MLVSGAHEKSAVLTGSPDGKGLIFKYSSIQKYKNVCHIAVADYVDITATKEGPTHTLLRLTFCLTKYQRQQFLF